ncbi:MAG: tetratricopeptide repeat protein [Desulforhopalus sp.]
MQPSTKQRDNNWTESSLAQHIGQLKSKKMGGELIRFLQARLADNDSVCLSCRPRLFNELGLAMLQREDITQAIDCFEQALNIEPDNSNALYNLANMWLYLKEFDIALKSYSRVLLLHPGHTGALYNSALCHALSGNKETALPLFVKVTELEPEYAGAQFWAGECLIGSDRAQEALSFFKRASILNPHHFEAGVGLAIASYNAKQFEEALSTCDDLLLNFDPSLLVLRIKGDCLLALDQIEEAALSHLKMAFMDFDSREFIITRIQQLTAQDADSARRYAQIVFQHLPDLEFQLPVRTDCNSTSCSTNIPPYADY